MALSTSGCAETDKLNLHCDSESESNDHGGTEANPLIPALAPFDSYQHVKPISPTPVDSTRDYDDPIVQPLKGPTFLFSQSSLHYLSSRQLVEYVDSIVTKHVNQHVHNVSESTAIQSTLTKLKSQLSTEHDSIRYTNYNDAMGTVPMTVPMKYNRSIDSLTVPMKYVQSNELAPKIFPIYGHSNEIEQKIVPMKQADSHDIRAIDEGANTNKANNTDGQWCTHSTRSQWPEFIPSSALLHHPSYSISVDKHCGVLRGSVRQDWNTIETDDDEERNWEELKPHWFELFFDLMFVAAIVHISTEVADAFEHAEYIFIYTVFPQFGLLILCWLEQVLYHSRFKMSQTGDGLLRFFYMSLVLFMGLSIGNMKNETSSRLFLISYMFTKCIMMVMFIKSSLIPRAKPHSIYMIIENVLSIVAVILIEIFVDTNHDESKGWIWCVIYSVLWLYSWSHMVVLVYSKCIRIYGVNIPINVPHIAERMGAFVLIILGETIISIMVQHIDSTRDELHIMTVYSVTMSWFVMVYCIGKLYFESQPSEHELHHHKKCHALSSSVNRARIFKWVHILLFFGLLGLGLGSKITVHELGHYDGDKAIFVFLPGISCCVICVCINIIRLMHPFDYSKEHPYLVIAVWILRVFCIIIMVSILFLWQTIHHAIILAIYVLSFIVQVIVDFEAKQRLIIAKTVHKAKSLRYYKTSRIKHRTSSDDVVEMTVTKELSCIGAF